MCDSHVSDGGQFHKVPVFELLCEKPYFFRRQHSYNALQMDIHFCFCNVFIMRWFTGMLALKDAVFILWPVGGTLYKKGVHIYLTR